MTLREEVVKNSKIIKEATQDNLNAYIKERFGLIQKLVSKYELSVLSHKDEKEFASEEIREMLSSISEYGDDIILRLNK